MARLPCFLLCQVLPIHLPGLLQPSASRLALCRVWMTRPARLGGFSRLGCLVHLAGRCFGLAFVFCQDRCLWSRLQTWQKNSPTSLVFILRVQVHSFQSEGDF